MTKAVAVPALPVRRFTLRCGAELLVSPRPGAQVCAVMAHLRGGARLDPEGLEGTAFLTGGLADQGTASFTEEEIASAIEDAGGALEGTSTGLAGSVASDRWKLLLEVLADCLSAPRYPRARIERQKRRLLDRLVVERDDPRVQGAWLFRRLVYGDNWMGWPEYGSLESVARIERKHLVAFHRKNWVGKRTMIAFCGDVDPLKVKRFLDRKLADWKPGTELPRPAEDYPAIARRSRIFAAKRQQVHVFLGHLGIKRTHHDFAPLVVMDHILGTGPGFTNRISRRLRDELGLAYVVHAAIHTSAGVLPGTFTAYIGTSPEHLRTATEGFQREIRLIQDELVTRAELDLAKSYITGALPISFERAMRRVQELIIAHRCELPADHLERFLVEVESVGREDVRRVAREHLHPDASCLVAAGPVSKRDLVGLS